MSVVLSLFVLLYYTNFLKKHLNSIIKKKIKNNLLTVEFVCHKHITPLSTTMKGWSI